MTRVRFLAGARGFSLSYHIQTSSVAHPISYIVGIRGYSTRGKNRWGMKLTTHLHLVPGQGWVELYLHSPYFFMVWCLISTRDNFTFTFLSSHLPWFNYPNNIRWWVQIVWILPFCSALFLGIKYFCHYLVCKHLILCPLYIEGMIKNSDLGGMNKLPSSVSRYFALKDGEDHKVSQDSQCTSWDWNQEPPKYKSDIEDIMPDGRINKLTDLQATKFLHLSGMTNVHY
jgi:hypothetical protein